MVTPRYLQSVTFGMLISPNYSLGFLNFIVVALKHNEYDLIALYDKLCVHNLGTHIITFAFQQMKSRSDKGHLHNSND